MRARTAATPPKAALDHLHGVDADLRAALGVASMEVRWPVIVEVHRDHDPEEATDRGQAACARVARSTALEPCGKQRREAAPAARVNRAGAGARTEASRRKAGRPPVCQNAERMDRRLANRNLRTALIAGAIAMIVFAASFVAGFVY